MGIVTNMACGGGVLRGVVVWTLPVETIDHLVLTWNTSNYPTNPDDGTPIPLASTDTYYVHEGLAEGTTYYYKVYVYSDATNFTMPTSLQSRAEQTGATSCTELFPVSGTILDKDGLPIDASVGVWTIEVTNPNCTNTIGSYPFTIAENALDGISSSGNFLHTRNFTIDPANTDEYLWIGDPITFTVKKDGVQFAQTTKIVTPRDVVEYSGGAVSFSNIEIREPDAPVNQLPSAPSVFPAAFNVSPNPLKTPSFVWQAVADVENASNPLHYAVEFAQTHTGAGGEIDATSDAATYHCFTSKDHGAMFLQTTNANYATPSATTWNAFPSGGLVATADPANLIKFTVPVEHQLDVGLWYWQVRVTDQGAM